MKLQHLELKKDMGMGEGLMKSNGVFLLLLTYLVEIYQ